MPLICARCALGGTMKAELLSKFKEAVQAFEQGHLEQAGELCMEVVETAPESHPAWHLGGVIAASSGDFEEAVFRIQQAILITQGFQYR